MFRRVLEVVLVKGMIKEKDGRNGEEDERRRNP
jgi:hypothetical protein